MNTHRHRFLLLGIIAAGAILRFYNLGELAFLGNEDYVVNAVWGIFYNGTPVYPSGAIYPRALPFTYLTAAAVQLLGASDPVFRLPNAIFSILAIPLAYLLAARLFGIRVALVAAALIAFSDWEILLGRTARMYGMFAFLFLASIYLLDRAMTEKERWSRWLAPLCMIAACFVHKLAFALLPVHVFYYLYRLPATSGRNYLAASALAVVVAYFANGALEQHFYSQGYGIANYAEASQPVLPAAGETTPATATAPESRDLWTRIKESDQAKILRERHLRLLAGALERQPAATIALLLVAVALALARGLQRFANPGSRVYGAALGLVAFPLALQQLGVALLVVLAYVLLGRVLEPAAVKARVARLLGLAGAALLAWLVAGVALLPGSLTGDLLAAARVAFSYPTSFLGIYLGMYPFLGVLALLSIGIAVARYLERGRIDALGYAAMIFFGTILVLGAHPLALTRPYARYVAFLNPYFLILAAAVIVAIHERLRDMPGAGRFARRSVVALALAAIVLLAARETAYSSIYLVNTRHGHNDLPPLVAGNAPEFYPDSKSPAHYVKRRAGPDDLVIAMDSLAFHAYFSRVDYQLRRTGGRDAERWLGKRTLFSEAELRQVLERHSDRNIWIVLEAGMLRAYGDDEQWARVIELIRERAGPAVFTARDGISRVYLVARSG